VDRHVAISVVAINSDYGFTLINVLDGFTGEKLAMLSISSETVYGLDPGTDITTVKVNQHELRAGDNNVVFTKS